ncbi:unnamed protein product [Fraxinus pennsylvanica]|uniref:O-fucosyltransferase family protein n=1 Tax=Fraxinus pennsylvanica TaxID=56036 RepID=A0AAD1ZAY6_9LAMI|nr:unnamed protein product [Fraxinus pennsylvanica]
MAAHGDGSGSVQGRSRDGNGAGSGWGEDGIGSVTIQALQSTHQYNASKEQDFILTEISFGQWKDQNEVWKSCWRIPSLEGKSFGGYVFFSLSNGPEYHAPQIVNAVGVARHLGATLVLPDIRGTKLREKGESLHIKETIHSNEWISLATFGSLKLQAELWELFDSMVGTLQKIGEFLKKIGFHKETTIYLTQTGWRSRLDELKNIFPNTFTKGAE